MENKMTQERLYDLEQQLTEIMRQINNILSKKSDELNDKQRLEELYEGKAEVITRIRLVKESIGYYMPRTMYD